MFTQLSDVLVLANELVLAESTDAWSQSFLGLDEDKRFALMIVGIGCLTGVLCTIVGCVSSVVTSYQRQRSENELKREMLDRGMHADEIAKVIEAAPSGFKNWAALWGQKKPS